MKGLIEDRLREFRQLYPVWEKKTIWDYFLETVKRYPENDFVVADGYKSYTYAETLVEVRRVAKALLTMGISSGDHIALQIKNSPEQVFAALAVLAVSAVKVPVNTSLSTKELSFVLTQSESKYLITDCQIHLDGNEPGPEKIIALPGAVCETQIPVISYDDFLRQAQDLSLTDNMLPGRADSVSDIIYTSGSTSAPKGVQLSHDMLMRSAYASCLNRGFEVRRRVFIPLPLFHVYGYVEGFLTAILVGGAVLLQGGKFAAEKALRFMQEAGANDILSVPSQMMAMTDIIRHTPQDFPRLHAVYCSASVCPEWVWPAIRKYFAVTDIITGYGMTEVCGASMQTNPGDGDEILKTRVGKLLPGGCCGIPEYGGHQIAYRVIDRGTGEDCRKGEIGELWCKGPVVTKGYYNRPDVNAKAFTPAGWFRTGDCGRFDDEGYLILAGRIDDMYKINGENVSPKFLEDTMGNCPEICHADIVGIPDDKHGFVGAAFIQLHEDNAVNREKAEQYCKNHLAKFQVPKYFFYMGDKDWPRTSTGKIQKYRLKELAISNSSDKTGGSHE